VKKNRVEPIMEDERLSDGNLDIDGPEKGEESERSPFRDEAYKDFMRKNKKATLKDRVSQGYNHSSC
jgi:hypothetical protein